MGMTLSAASKSPGSSPRFFASVGRCSAISSATAAAARHEGPALDAKMMRARPPISAERTTFASATTTLGSEIAENLLFGHPLRLTLLRDLLGQAKEDFALDVLR